MIIPDIGINHEGDLSKATKMLRDIHASGCKYVKFQTHIPEAEMLYNDIIPSNANESIWNMMQRCALSEDDEIYLKGYAEELGLVYLSTPFSREAVDRLERMNVSMYKIGSGECNNYPLVKYIVSTGKPIILSTGMNTFYKIDKAVDIMGDQLHTILHCVSMYPTPYDKVNLNRMLELGERYGKPYGLSDHSKGIYTSLAAITLGASVVEKHFTSDKTWKGSDVPISIDPTELFELVIGERAIKESLKVSEVNDRDVRKFAYASIVSIKEIKAGEKFTSENIWVKRPGGGIPAEYYEGTLGLCAKIDIDKDTQIRKEQICD
ncbi:MAG: N-acetylneuraminate synthase family protein [Proteobacteria bacterium]|nr:N-acetylneuraminate synthase family protein [Pseudomonadota bacterium]MBU1456985.1 N-acetylneuraminate synthase family protein [Pseudomonadota bacterium]